MLPDKIENKTGRLPISQTQATTQLLLKEYRALRRTQKKQCINVWNVDAFVVQIDRDDCADLSACQQTGRLLSLERWCLTCHTHHCEPRRDKLFRHEARVRDGDAEDECFRPRRIAGQSLPLVHDHARAHLVAGDQAIYRVALSGLIPRHLRKVCVVIAPKVFEGRQ